MVSTQRDSQLCLLLLLGLLGMVISFHGAPGNLTPTQWFTAQHINMTSPQCTLAMQRINRLYFHVHRTCKPINTFLHEKYGSVAKICKTRNVTCRDRHHTNCHQSSMRVMITYCNITSYSTNYNNCSYSTTLAHKIYIVACDNRTPWDDPAYMMVPVHLDRLI